MLDVLLLPTFWCRKDPLETYILNENEAECYKLSAKKVGSHIEVVRRFRVDNFFLNLIKRYTMPTKDKRFRVVSDNLWSHIIYMNDNTLEYISLFRKNEDSPYYVFIKRIYFDLALVYVKYSNKDGFTECETPLSDIIKYSRIPQILNPQMRCNTFIQNTTTKHEAQLLPAQYLVGSRVNNADHASLYVQWLL